ncbi:MAG TPA: hypothetical protein VNF74_03475 [Terriglobales bacterium]|nr:hypothetical protein [Terriglobales bacterium]
MKLVESLLGRWVCSHRWVRARWQDGSYGLRCAQCMKAYPHTWNEIIAGPGTPAPAAKAPLRRAA